VRCIVGHTRTSAFRAQLSGAWQQACCRPKCSSRMAQQPTPLLGPALPARPADTAGRLPVVDLRRFRGAATRAAFVTELCAAFAEHGFLYLVGHGIAPATRAGAMSASREFFALPAEAKRAVDSTLSPHVRGYSTLGRERTVGVADAREVWEMGPDADSIASHSLGALPPFMRLQGPNLWPERPVAFRPVGPYDSAVTYCRSRQSDVRLLNCHRVQFTGRGPDVRRGR
jgi:hypothetical protein